MLYTTWYKYTLTPHKMHVQSQFHNKISGSELNFLFFPPLYDRYSQVENAYVHVIIYV